MPVTLACPTCKLKQKVDEEVEGTATCPHCDDVLVPLKAKAKARADDDRSRKNPARKRDEDDDDGAGLHDGKAAKSLGLSTGFKNRELMKQVEEELSRNEVLHFACRPCAAVAKYQAIMVGVFGLIGASIAILGPIMKLRQARLGWYAVTDRRAIVFYVSLWGKSGAATDYTPREWRRMRVSKSWFVKGAGDLIFRTEVRHHTRTVHGAHGGTRTEHSTSVTHYGFLGIEDVRDVEALICEVLLGRDRDDDD